MFLEGVLEYSCWRTVFKVSVKTQVSEDLGLWLCHQRKRGPLVDSLVSLRYQRWPVVKWPAWPGSYAGPHPE